MPINRIAPAPNTLAIPYRSAGNTIIEDGSKRFFDSATGYVSSGKQTYGTGSNPVALLNKSERVFTGNKGQQNNNSKTNKEKSFLNWLKDSYNAKKLLQEANANGGGFWRKAGVVGRVGAAYGVPVAAIGGGLYYANKSREKHKK